MTMYYCPHCGARVTERLPVGLAWCPRCQRHVDPEFTNPAAGLALAVMLLLGMATVVTLGVYVIVQTIGGAQ